MSEIQEEYERKDKNREIQKRIARSAEIGASRVKKMKERERARLLPVFDTRKRCREWATKKKTTERCLHVSKKRKCRRGRRWHFCSCASSSLRYFPCFLKCSCCPTTKRTRLIYLYHSFYELTTTTSNELTN